MATRNPDFPQQFDILCGGQWLSSLMVPLNISIPAQIQLRHMMVIICHSYYRAFLRADRGLFLHLHDLDNLCHLIDSIQPGLSQALGRNQVFLIYSLIVSIFGNAEVPAFAQVWLEQLMEQLGILPTPALPTDHPSFQVLPF